jgi:hypothetical protein
MEKNVDNVKEWWSDLRIGEGHVAAMGRLGLQELRNAANPSRESVAGSEMGLYGTQTQGEIADNRRDHDTMADIKAKAKERQQERENGRDGHEKDRGVER